MNDLLRCAFLAYRKVKVKEMRREEMKLSVKIGLMAE